jgi:hypothetical protein
MNSEKLLLLFFVVFGNIVMAQTKPATASKLGGGSARVPPAIKCVDPDSAVACKSFKQLIDARDSGVLFGVLGDPKDAGRHFGYVCPRRGLDTFTMVEFAVSEKREFKPFITVGDDKLKRLFAEVAVGQDPATPLSLSAVNQWNQDHRLGQLFATGFVGLTIYQDGELAGIQIENGEWSRPAAAPGAAHDEAYASFDGGHYWVQSYNQLHAGGSPEVDDPEKLHLHIDGRVVYAHYTYKDRKGDLVDYVLQIHRSTGRFTETFKAAGDQSDNSGTCMIFKY